ncbi:MAG: hypothetical protein ABDH23_07085 [Endomicrobiia bacterium]
MKKIIILILLYNSVVYSQIDTFLSWGVSAKSIGMGRVHTSLAEDGTSIFYNPSLLSKVKTFEFLGSYALFYENNGYGYLSFLSPALYGTAGIGIQNLSISDVKLRDLAGKILGTADARLTSIYFSYGINLNELFISSEFITLRTGISAKLISQKIYNLEAGGISIDIANQIDFDFGFYKLLCGFNFGNLISSSLKFYIDEQIPFIFRMGVGLLIFDESLKIGVDTIQSKQIKNINFGIEYTLWKLFSVRGGVNDTEIALGIGITRQNIQFNYAFALNRSYSNIDFGMIHMFDFKIKWSLKRK